MSFHPPATESQLPHYVAIFYVRKSFDLHSNGLTKEMAETSAKEEVMRAWSLPSDTVFPPVPWEKYEEGEK